MTLTEKIIELVPEITSRHTYWGKTYEPSITLADVLRAIHTLPAEQRPSYFNVGCDGGFYEVEYTYPDRNKCVIEHRGLGGMASWDFTTDLDGQSDTTKAFIGKILGV